MARAARQPEQLSAEAKDLFDALNGESPLACVLVGAAALEQAVVSLLMKHFLVADTSTELACPHFMYQAL